MGSKKIDSKSNRLLLEKSPYLLQHAYNPVDWYPWGDEAFAKAKTEDKPIFLSIGYSTCHWCHVMERESFEDEEVAAILNEKYISIKVDREERPDVDHIYMTVCQAITGQGGWPLTVIMSPEKKPFFAGTYFPKNSKMGRAGLTDILKQIHSVWTHDREKIDKNVQHIENSMLPQFNLTQEGTITKETLASTYELYRRKFDHGYGGFGDSPKFPTPHNLLFLLRHWKLTGEEFALEMVEKTLRAMHDGGIYDHVGLGFSRYSVDREWLVPHFEKMLYDNALLSYAYLEAFQATNNEYYASVAQDIFTYVIRDMTDEEGGFYSAEDADSEGEEGKFYVWTPAEVKEVLGLELGQLYCDVYDITEHGNFEGQSIPNLIRHSVETWAGRMGKEPIELKEQLEQARQKLFVHRDQRIHPYKDDKILTAWNGLMIAALAKGATVLSNETYLHVAQNAVQFLMKTLCREDGRLLARYRDGDAAYLGYVDDYAFLIWGLIELYEASVDTQYLQQAIVLQEDMLRLFWDDQHGGFFFYGSDGEQLIARPKEIYDGATPSGNGVAAHNLLRLFHLTGKMEWQEKAENLLQAFAGSMQEYPTGFSFSMLALQIATGKAQEIVVAGEKDSPETKEMLDLIRKAYLPLASLSLHDPADSLAALAPSAADKTMQNGKVSVYICEDFACQAPVTNVEDLKKVLHLL